MDLEQYRDDVARAAEGARDWFFHQYLYAWTAAAADPSAGPGPVLDYWVPPLSVSVDDPDPARAVHGWCTDPDSVLAYLAAQQEPLKAAGYTHTEVPDSRVTAYSSHSAGIEVIWSRRTADNTEIERLAVHFEVRRDGSGAWRVIAIAAHPTGADRIADAFVTVNP
ncbi:DUF6841 family protein [Actinacidiphila glaucinigra]|uniref:DUF6841 domain-containing protein n=1 Tax=Actinacidiphila glaucinigra TaxID=235986 RepID=A0A239NXG3_9ACTN|nr:hypothetical protein [Actinacidiphila glaucinigra]SNT59133.1 hypothetical protein SAMN05216252_15322 [Actinacidiphila glaucinigra]